MARKTKAATAAALQIPHDCTRDSFGFGALPGLGIEAGSQFERPDVSALKARLLAAGFESMEESFVERLAAMEDGDEKDALSDPWDDGSVAGWNPRPDSGGWTMAAVMFIDGKVASGDADDAVAVFARPAGLVDQVPEDKPWPFPQGKPGASGPEVASDVGNGGSDYSETIPPAEQQPARQRIPGRFQFITPTLLKLKHINVRGENHGKEKVSAVDLDFTYEGMNCDVLDLLQAGLCEALYYDPQAEVGQEQLAGVRPVLPKMRFPRMDTLPWSTEATGMDLTVIYGTGKEASNIEFVDGKVMTKRAELKEGGSATVFFRYSTCAIPDGAIDKLRKKLEQLVEVTLVQHEELRREAIDGTVGHPGVAAAAAAAQAAAEQDPTSVFCQVHGSDEQTDGDQATEEADAEA